MRQTLELPPHQKLELAKLLGRPCRAQRISRKRCERAPGKLRFMAAAMPGAQGPFGALQLALNEALGNRILVNHEPKDHLCAFARPAADVGCRPTHLAEVIPQDPSHLGATAAATSWHGRGPL